ncbi:MAG: MltA domain-containing protein, partial [Phycisphaerae bacterium]
MKMRFLAYGLVGLSLAMMGGCKSQNATIVDTLNEDVETTTNGWGLRKLDPKDYPDMRAAFMDRAGLEHAIDKSLQYLGAASSLRVYPSGLPGDTITHDQIAASLVDFKNLLHTLRSPDEFQQNLLTRYDVYESIGYNNKGDVWFTGYFTPIYYGSRTPTDQFKYPVYRCPPDLVRDHITGDILGRRMSDGSMQPYPTRQELTQSGQLRGLELLYLKDPMEAYIIQVQGSAKVILPDGTAAMIGYDGKNGRDYRGLGSELVKDGKIDKKHLSLPAVLMYFQQHPEERDGYIMRNDSFAFLKEYPVTEWPSGSLGVQVTARRALATDKKIFPRASLTFVDVPVATAEGDGTMPYNGFLLDQDTGGAIKAPGRADIYMGIGAEAGMQAGRQFAKGKLYYVFLKPELIGQVPIQHPALHKPAAPRSSTPGARSGSTRSGATGAGTGSVSGG